jgi:hypothetical protein
MMLPLLPLLGVLALAHSTVKVTAEVVKSNQEKSVEDNFEPDFGTIVYCNLGPAEHSGVYTRDGKIAQLNGNGKIELVSLKQFTDNMSTVNKKIMVPFPADDPIGNCDTWWEWIGPVFDDNIGKRALSMIGKKRDYNFVLDNCHQFCAGCITGKFDNEINFFFFLENLIEQKVNFGDSITWFEWDWENNQLIRRKPFL